MLYGIITSQLGDVTSTISVAPGQTTTVQELLRSECAGVRLQDLSTCCSCIYSSYACMLYSKDLQIARRLCSKMLAGVA
jgi:hypothetical protein